MTPDEITRASFDTKRRGLDPEGVKRHLASAAATVHGLQAERNSLAEQVASLTEQLAEAQSAPVPQDELDEDALTERLGQDAARVLAEARSAAADRIAEAEVQADDIRAAAEEVFAERSAAADEEASRIRASAESTVRERTAEAEQAAAQIIARAEADAESMRSTVVGERQSADADAARIVREAELTRRQILEDLARRRSAARRQIEQLRAGRERLLASHETVRRALDDISEELTISMSEARAAAETAGHTVSDTTIEELEAEIETARLTGLLDTGPLPVVTKEPVAEASPEADAETTANEKAKPDAKAKPEEAVEPDEEASAESASAPFDHEVEAPEVQDDAEADAAGVAAGNAAAEEVETKHDEEPVEQAPAADSSGSGLAEVVQLDRARGEVDTATHPATGRDASSNRAASATNAAKSDEDSDDTSTPPVLEAVATPTPDEILPEDDSVGDLFATLRSSTEKAPPKTSTAKKKPAKKSGAKKSTAKKSANGSKKSTTKKSSEPVEAAAVDDDAVDSAEMARRLKRVLADEQSRAMSRLKAASSTVSIDDLLGDPSAHHLGYWVEVTTQIDNVSDDDAQLKKPVDELVDTIRHRVADALSEAGDDTESAVSSLRSVYREVKTQRISICADEVCRMATGRSADRS